jgi:hypothetical protein
MDGGGWMMDLLCGREERRRSGGEGETVYGLQSAVRAQQTGYCA